ncbi:DUF92 domain-containing protein [Paenibacillus thalictri]|uniref:DUF92 domain-containing protein n=1 Tax=Paenibacillus thalictri TaxID=2527873 RepID=A0A4Q9E137_9BACL|nr:DUF92 domain-containing protein [Paenibacillus thalictri]TBL81271.1 DUF92 domain-containing protein [Paenibacillus thalictri]
MIWAIGFVCSIAVAGLAYWKKSLSASGAAAAVAVGTLLYALGNLAWYGTLLAFFISSTLCSKWKHHRKAAAESGYAKGGRRDAGQVAANGGLGALFCVAHALWPHPLWWSAFVGVMAAVNADTWATEIGGLSRSAPRSILTGRVVTAGTSGGITGLGLAASAAGGLFIGAAAWLLQLGAAAHEALIAEGAVAELPFLLLLGLIGGMCGSLTDSLLGATYQAMYRCPSCGREVEKPQHCGVPAKRIRGLSFFTNDTVNMLSSLLGAAVCAGIGLLLS